MFVPKEDSSKVQIITLKNTTPNKKTNEQLAREVICGKWGNGAERKNRLESAGYKQIDSNTIF